MRVLAAVITVLIIAHPAVAHTADGEVSFREAFYARLDAEVALTPELVEEWLEFRRRHEPVRLPTEARFTGMGSDAERWRPLVQRFFPPGQVEVAMRVLACESGGNPDAKNPNSSASGLFQHLARFWPERSAAAGWGGADIFDPEANVAVAAWLQATGGWQHWECY